MTRLVADAELPPKIGVHPRPDGSFAHAMPARCVRRADATTGDDLLGMKWVDGLSGQPRPGLPPINALVVSTTRPRGAHADPRRWPITALRTAAVSGVVDPSLRPARRRGATRGDLGAGVQGHSHRRDARPRPAGRPCSSHDRHPERRELVAMARRWPRGRLAVATPARRPRRPTWSSRPCLRPARGCASDDPGLAARAMPSSCAVDYAAMCAAAGARPRPSSSTDDRGQFLANRDAGQFDDYPDPTMTIGRGVLAGRRARRRAGRGAPGSASPTSCSHGHHGRAGSDLGIGCRAERVRGPHLGTLAAAGRARHRGGVACGSKLVARGLLAVVSWRRAGAADCLAHRPGARRRRAGRCGPRAVRRGDRPPRRARHRPHHGPTPADLFFAQG
jgi:hypothetical protein